MSNQLNDNIVGSGGAEKKNIVYVVDDESMVLKAVTQSIAKLGCHAYSFNSAQSCLLAQEEKICQLIVSDINMPGMDGIELLKKVRQNWPETKVLLVTGFGDIPLAVEALKLGAADFVEKPLDEEVLLPKVSALLKEFNEKQALPLSEAEIKVLRLVASGKSNKEIAYLIDRSIRTVENHRHRLMKKLKVDSHADLIKIALASGLTTIE